MRRFLSTLYGGLAYLAFLLPIGYLLGFLANAGVPKTVDRGAGPLGPSLVVDILLLMAFGVQHSVMARPGFKRWLRRRVPEGLERSTYVLVSGLTLVAVFWLWRPIPAILWDVSGTPLSLLAWGGFAAGWTLAVWATFALSHLHLFGVSQSLAHARGSGHPRVELRESRLYRIVRHPMTAGLLLAFWSAPTMTLGHAVFAAGMTVYSLVATVLEERDLLRTFPERYGAYRQTVPALVPFLRPIRAIPGSVAFGLELFLVAVLSTLPFLSLRPLQAETPGVDTVGALESRSMVTGGVSRTFYVYDPVSASLPRPTTGSAPSSTPRSDPPVAGPAPRPLVLALHGTGGDGMRLRGFLGGALDRAAARRGWLVTYPDAYGGAWDDCRRRAAVLARNAGVDDIGFLRTVVERMVRERGADPSRVFVLGYSGGGHMAFRLALEAPSLVAGIAVFGASPPPDEESVCTPVDGALPVLLVNGTADLVSPFQGGEVIAPSGMPLGRVLASEEGARYFESRAAGRAEVRLVRVEGGGHVIPGGDGRFPDVAGRTSSAFEGAEEAMLFFERQRPPVETRGAARPGSEEGS